MLQKRLIAALITAFWLTSGCLPSLAATSVSGTVNCTAGSNCALTGGTLTWNAGTGTFTLTDTLTLNSGSILNIIGASGNGGNFTLTIPNGGSFTSSSGSLLNLSGTSGNGNGGNFLTTLLGTGTLSINGTIRSNGIGTGRGGTITLNGTTINMTSGALVEALGGTGSGGGLGGVIDINQSGSGVFTVPSGVTLQTNGLTSATQNLITIDALNDVAIGGTVNANGLSGSSGGKIVLTAKNGQTRIQNTGRMNATGNGAGTGGTIEFNAYVSGRNSDVDNCSNNSCSGGGDVETWLFHNSSIMNVAGGSGNNGTYKFGRSTAGDINFTMGKITATMLRGSGRVEIGNDANTVNTTVSNFVPGTDFNNTNPTIALYATTNITGTSGNDWNGVEAHNTNGTIALTNTTTNMSVSSLTGNGTANLISAANGGITLNGSTFNGTTNIQTNGTINGSGNATTGTINFMGQNGAGNKSGAITFTNGASTTIGRMEASSAAITTTGASSDITLSNANITNGTTLTATGNIDASAATNNFGTSVGGSGVNVNLRDNAGTLTVSGLTATGTTTLTGPGGISLTNLTSNGAATLTSTGTNITGSTGNTFKSTATLTTGSNTNGNINVTGDFQGNTSLNANQIDVTDNAGDLTVTSYTSGANASTLKTTGAGGNVVATINDLNPSGAGKLTITSANNATVTGSGWNDATDTLVVNTTSGDIALNSFTANSITGRTTAQAGPSAGVWIGTTGNGDVTLTNMTVNGTADIAAGNNTISGTGNTFKGATVLNAGTGTINVTASDFQSTTLNSITAGTATISDNAGGLTITSGTVTGAASLTAGGATTPDLTVSNFTDTGGTTTLTAGRNITATNTDNFGTVAISAPSGNVNITDSTGGMTVSSMTGSAAGTNVLTALSNGTLTVNNANAGGTTTLQSRGNITGSGNTLSGAININGDAGAADRAGSINFSNNGATNINRVVANDATLTAATGSSNLTVANADISNGATLNATGNVIASSTTNDFGTGVGGTAVNIDLYDKNGTLNINGITASGNLTATGPAGGNIDVKNSTITGTTNVTTNGGGNITGSGNTFRSTANISTGGVASGSVTLSADYQGNTNVTARQADITNTTGNLTVASWNTGNATSTINSTAAGSNVDVTVNSVSNGGKVTITADKNITLTGSGFTNSGATLVANSNSAGNILVQNITQTGALGITGGTAAQAGPSTGIWMGTNGGTMTLLNDTQNGNVNLTTNNAAITLGTSAKPIAVTGTTAFSAGTADVLGYGTYTGAVSGSGGRIFLEASSGSLNSGGLTASNATGWNGASDQSLYLLADNGNITGNGFTTSGAANVVLWAGASGGTGYINVTGINSGQNLSMFATGNNAGTAINASGSVAGNITATGLTAANATTAANGGINFTATSGNLKSALIWADGGGKTINLTTNSGSILQDLNAATNPFVSTSTGVASGKTVWGTGPINLTANGGYIDTGVMALTASGTGGNVTAKASSWDPSGVSINLRGRADGTTTATNTTGGNTIGHVYLGTSIGASQTNLDDSPTTVYDAMGNTTIKAAGNVKLYGGFFGALDVTGATVTGVADKGNLNFTQIVTSAGAGTNAINLTALQGKMTGGNLSTVAGANIFLQAGSSMPRDKMANITLTSVNSGGNIDVIVAGSSNGLNTGSSVNITGSKAGTSSAKDLNNATPLGTVVIP